MECLLFKYLPECGVHGAVQWETCLEAVHKQLWKPLGPGACGAAGVHTKMWKMQIEPAGWTHTASVHNCTEQDSLLCSYSEGEGNPKSKAASLLLGSKTRAQSSAKGRFDQGLRSVCVLPLCCELGCGAYWSWGCSVWRAQGFSNFPSPAQIARWVPCLTE